MEFYRNWQDMDWRIRDITEMRRLSHGRWPKLAEVESDRGNRTALMIAWTTNGQVKTRGAIAGSMDSDLTSATKFTNNKQRPINGNDAQWWLSWCVMMQANSGYIIHNSFGRWNPQAFRSAIVYWQGCYGGYHAVSLAMNEDIMRNSIRMLMPQPLGWLLFAWPLRLLVSMCLSQQTPIFKNI